MPDCIFCSIINGSVASDKVYEDEFVCAFRDIAPKAPVHILIVPKMHLRDVSAVNAENSQFVAKCFEAAAKIAESEKVTGGYRIISNNGALAGQTVFHLHFHLLAGKKMSDL
ncbi:MAG: histidine triad nucleotide-binding protein [Oscillospiraceae bacterium]|nr:histidine triad nucleotide-binding protein [Oscillospiraceae bacterium]